MWVIRFPESLLGESRCSHAMRGFLYVFLYFCGLKVSPVTDAAPELSAVLKERSLAAAKCPLYLELSAQLLCTSTDLRFNKKKPKYKI